MGLGEPPSKRVGAGRDLSCNGIKVVLGVGDRGQLADLKRAGLGGWPELGRVDVMPPGSCPEVRARQGLCGTMCL